MSAWFYSARQDLLFLIPAIWMAPLLLLAFYFTETPGRIIVIVITALLSSGHLLGPILLYVMEPSVRRQVQRQRPKASFEIILISSAPLILAFVGWYFLQDGERISFLGVVAALGASYLFLNSHHYTMQHYGITCFYLNKDGAQDRRWIMSTIWIVTFFIPIAVWYFANLRFDFATNLLSLNSAPPFFTEGAAAVVCVCLLGLFGRAYLRNYLSVPLALNYLSICLISLLICLSPLFFTLTLNSAVHWIQSIYLTSYQYRPSTPLKYRRYVWPASFLFLIAVSLTVFLIARSSSEEQTTISTFGKIQGPFDGLTPSAVFVLGISLSIAFVHFYLERFIYRKNPSLLKRQADPTLARDRNIETKGI